MNELVRHLGDPLGNDERQESARRMQRYIESVARGDYGERQTNLLLLMLRRHMPSLESEEDPVTALKSLMDSDADMMILRDYLAMTIDSIGTLGWDAVFDSMPDDSHQLSNGGPGQSHITIISDVLRVCDDQSLETVRENAIPLLEWLETSETASSIFADLKKEDIEEGNLERLMAVLCADSLSDQDWEISKEMERDMESDSSSINNDFMEFLMIDFPSPYARMSDLFDWFESVPELEDKAVADNRLRSINGPGVTRDMRLLARRGIVPCSFVAAMDAVAAIARELMRNSTDNPESAQLHMYVIDERDVGMNNDILHKTIDLICMDEAHTVPGVKRLLGWIARALEVKPYLIKGFKAERSDGGGVRLAALRPDCRPMSFVERWAAVEL